MTRARSTVDTGEPETPAMASYDASRPPTPKPSTTRLLTPPRSPRNLSNRLWVQKQQRRVFLEHLKRWSLDHDSSTYFQGKISLLPPDPESRDELVLGKVVHCVLTDSGFTDSRKMVSIKLFGPQMVDGETKERGTKRRTKSENIDISTHKLDLTEYPKDTSSPVEDDGSWPPPQSKSVPPNNYYQLVIRCGSGWVSARDYFNKLYFTNLPARVSMLHTADYIFGKRSQALGPLPSPNDTVSIQPLFQPFLRLPPELQEMILMYATGLTRDYDLCHGALSRTSGSAEPPISLSGMFRISPPITATMLPYIFHRTNFHFGLTGTTNFLWQCGPGNRRHIRRLAFHFGHSALLHCMRWLSPDELYELLEPPHQNYTQPGLPRFWRCQLRALVKEVHLLELTIDVKGIPQSEIAMMVRIVVAAFGSVERVKIIETSLRGSTKVLAKDDEKLVGLGGESWREMSKGYVERYKRQWHSLHLKKGLGEMSMEELDGLMDKNKEFFDS
ncbi:hypothetical protein PtrSN002B_004617 [Pyrenophora tritici-repentis]|uniref:Uncharacterized protein n=3 Tax=Pyrenophora tritici-repentis TaxID=45151 RepID=A0A2W1HST9_9PLEO|nr:uncharacterized protein PTRG_12158 [Pyrenophora tritici-repentis Pt-1C-BFP]KAA8614732.1 hypothetical protein PtrV1_11762 [Pyrenophora tritici-repentis]EDU47351.1 predicted protein [Pyrenophora tritici-repentis Pt-1C-BFP]KAF7444560.1 hypothetical protein A1F99_111130 [Pyrenophora tritici-repentis]KAF7564782.1 hypothetical protein PtrM4_042160 [Pyrenophora tritici-repentis]KAG9378800.1 hypothetical protein A1F94_010569 [Pyrenophora tritici-repentis]